MKVNPKTWIMRVEGGVSWTKVFYWFTTVCAALVLLPGQMAAAGLTLPPWAMAVVTIAGIISFLAAGIKNRDASSPAIPAEPPKVDAPKV